VDYSRPSGEDRWQRSRDLMNSEVREVGAQRLGTLGCERRSAKWSIRNTWQNRKVGT
jgi:hypothetical protein